MAICFDNDSSLVFSPFRYRVFSHKINLSLISGIPSIQSARKQTGLPINSSSFLATGSKLKEPSNASGSGLPRCDKRMTLAPFDKAISIVGNAALIRAALVITPFSIGTFKSRRIMVRKPCRSRSCIRGICMSIDLDLNRH